MHTHESLARGVGKSKAVRTTAYLKSNNVLIRHQPVNEWKLEQGFSGSSLAILDQTGDGSDTEESSSNSEDETKADEIAKDDGLRASDVKVSTTAKIVEPTVEGYKAAQRYLDGYFAEEREGWKG
jgi:hypothetical protein